VSIETVSEYQQELLRAIAIDHRSEQRLPALEETFLQMTAIPTNGSPTTAKSSLSESDARSHLSTAQDQLMRSIRTKLMRSIMKHPEQRTQRSKNTGSSTTTDPRAGRGTIKLSSKIDELSETINGSDQDDRVEALKKRKEAKAEYEEVDAELSTLQEQRDQGFPQKQEEIRKRHALDIRVTPLTVTQVEYERGEIDVELAEQGVSRTVTLGYGSGIGTTETVQCSSCDRVLSVENPLNTIKVLFDVESAVLLTTEKLQQELSNAPTNGGLSANLNHRLP